MPVTIGGAVRQRKISIGKQVRITGSHELECWGKIAEISGDSLKIELPVTDVARELCKLQEVTVTYVVADDAAYSFKAAVTALQCEAGLLHIRQAEAMKRQEQRSHYRLKTAKLINIQLTDSEGTPQGNWWQASLLDLSRGGASILSPVDLPVGCTVKVWIPLDEVDHLLEVKADVVRLRRGEEGQRIAGVRFAELSLTDQEKVLDYILTRLGGGSR